MPQTLQTTQNAKLVKASARHLRIAPRKMRLVTNLVKGMNVLDALVQLEHTNKKAAQVLIKLLKSAVANAKHNFLLEPEHLFVKNITADMGKVMKRYFPRARGSAFLIRKKMSHVSVVLEERKAQSKTAKSRISLFRKVKESAKPAAEGAELKEIAAKKEPVESGKKPQVFKTDEQRKLSTIQQKRRLFNRRSGE